MNIMKVKHFCMCSHAVSHFSFSVFQHSRDGRGRWGPVRVTSVHKNVPRHQNNLFKAARDPRGPTPAVLVIISFLSSLVPACLCWDCFYGVPIMPFMSCVVSVNAVDWYHVYLFMIIQSASEEQYSLYIIVTNYLYSQSMRKDKLDLKLHLYCIFLFYLDICIH